MTGFNYRAGGRRVGSELWAILRLAAIILVLFLVLAATGRLLRAAPNQLERWQTARIDPKRTIELDKAVALYRRNQTRYAAVGGVPPMVIFGLHYREGSNNFNLSLAQGDPITHRSRNVPRGRLPYKDPPYTWEELATDALQLDHMNMKDWRHAASALQAISNYNGTGYDNRGIPTPYLWGGTTLYGVAGAPRGKYVSDGRFSPWAVDRQLGVAAILLRMRERGIEMPFR